MNKAIFLDRDGVINKTIFRMGKQRAPYSIEEFDFFDGVQESVEAFKIAGYLIIVVTNQPDVSRGWVTKNQVDLINNLVQKTLGVHEVLSCFHDNQDNCTCRKPRPGMLLSAAEKWDIDLSKSFMVGDRLSDVDAGLRAGCKSILISKTIVKDQAIIAHHQCIDLAQAAQWIISTDT